MPWIIYNKEPFNVLNSTKLHNCNLCLRLYDIATNNIEMHIDDTEACPFSLTLAHKHMSTHCVYVCVCVCVCACCVCMCVTGTACARCAQGA